MFTPRPKQLEVLAYRGGKMGVSAVPGSGKTQTLSALAAQIVASGELGDDQEVLIVTLVNSAVENFSQRVAGFIQEQGLLPHLGYHVRTLHGLAHDIVRERPGLVGLADDFQILDERAADQIREDAALTWLRGQPDALDDYLDPDLDDNRRDWLRRDQLPELVNNIALAFIRYAKDLEVTPDGLRQQLDGLPLPLPLAKMGCAIYADYQRALAYRGAVDFDDLIRLALLALRQDEKFLQRLQLRWPYILEDEAQDSSRLQEEILWALVGERGNWVRVGDPNQAIYETFTTASPQYLRNFLTRPEVYAKELPNSGRSSRSIIWLANRLVAWTQAEHPQPVVQEALTPPAILPTPKGDPQPNPPDDPAKIVLAPNKFTPQEELAAVVDSLQRWLPDHPDETVAVLVPRNQRGFELVNELKRRGIDHMEILRSTSATRLAAGVLGNVIRYLADPQSPSKLATTYRVWRRADREAGGNKADGVIAAGANDTGIADVDDANAINAKARLEAVSELLRKCRNVEDYLWPRPDRDWLANLEAAGAAPEVLDELVQFGELARRWQGTALLPIDQVLLTLSQDLFTEPADLAIAHKLAGILRQAGAAHRDWRLPEMTEELAVVARNERRFLGFSEDDTGFDPDQHKGQVVIATIHKAKGLEWDRVHLMSVNDYDFPSGMPYDKFISERWFVRDRLNLEAEALAQLDAALSTNAYDWYREGAASERARLEYVAERLRLLYVGITRARRELVVTWNTGRDGSQQPAIPLVALQGAWEDHLHRPAPKARRQDRR